VRSRQASPLRRLIGVVFLLGGLGLLALGGLHAWNTWEIAQRQPLPISAAELQQAKDSSSWSGAWVSYTFAQSKPTGMALIRRRSGGVGEVQAPCLLVQAGDKWLIAAVAPGFRGNRLVGLLLPAAPDAEELGRRIRAGQKAPPVLLPYEFNAIDGCESEHRLRYEQAGIVGFVGLLAVVLGLVLVRGRRQPAPAEPDPGPNPFGVRPLPQG
jgi:hypothetical protein